MSNTLPFSRTGTVELRIEHFSNFVNKRALPWEPQVQRLSEPVFIQGLPWRILAIPRVIRPHHRNDQQINLAGRPAPKALGIFLQCNGEDPDLQWRCETKATLSVLSQQEGVPSNVRRIHHSFYAKENDWGFSQYLTCETLLNPNNPWIKDDTIIIRAEVEADNPNVISFGTMLFPQKGQQKTSSGAPTTEDMFPFLDTQHPSNDVTFVVKGNRKVHANRGILSVYSPVFAAMFNTEMVEKGMSEIPLGEIEYEELIELLYTIYPGKKPIDEHNLKPVLKLADRFLVASVIEQCEKFLLGTSPKQWPLSTCFLIAQTYPKLSTFKDACIAAVSTMDVLNKMRGEADYQHLTEETKAELLDKFQFNAA